MFETLFSERGLSLDRLKVLIEVRDAGSIAAAAPGDPVRQSQYSRQLRELSEFFGCEVAQRRGKILRLTAPGERLAEIAREHLRTLDDFRSECRAERVSFTVGAGDSLVQWLIIPRIGSLLAEFPGTHFATLNLRTNEIVQQLTDGRLDFGIIRKNAVAPGLKSVPLGVVSYVLLVPETLLAARAKLTLADVLAKVPLAAQTTDGVFTNTLRDIAQTSGVKFDAALACQSFPQTMAAVRSGRFAAIVPALATNDLDGLRVQKISGGPLDQLSREAMLAWNPRLVRIRPNAEKIAARLQRLLAL